MSKVTIEEQIEAVKWAHALAFGDKRYADKWSAGGAAAIETLKWVKRHAPSMKAVLGEFEGSRVAVRDE